jgi:hypothetical protein
MTSLHGCDPAFIYTSEPVIREFILNPNSVLGQLDNNNSFTKIVNSVPEYKTKLNDPYLECTLFIPKTTIQYDIPDFYDARVFIQSHISNTVFYPDFFKKRLTYITTQNPTFKIQTEFIQQNTLLNNRSRIISFQKVNKSMIYYIDTPLL